MASKLLIGAVTVGGLAAGFSLAAAASGSHAPAHRAAVAEVRHLYDTEVALNGQERHLQALLEFSEAELAAKPASAAPTQRPLDLPWPPPPRVPHAVPRWRSRRQRWRPHRRRPRPRRPNHRRRRNDPPRRPRRSHRRRRPRRRARTGAADGSERRAPEPVTDPAGKERARRRRATVPTVVVTAATIGTTGLALAWSVDTAPVTTGARTAVAATVALEIAREKSGIDQLHHSIAATMSQIDALHTAAPATASASTTTTRTAGGAEPGSAAGAAAGASRCRPSRQPPSAAPAAAAPAPTPAAAPAARAAPAPTPVPAATPTTQPPPPPPLPASAAGDRDDGRVGRRMSQTASVSVLGTVRAMASDVQIHGALGR